MNTERAATTAVATNERERALRNKKERFGCRRCGATVDIWTKYVLPGDYIASMCDQCREDIHALDATPEFVAERNAFARLGAYERLISGQVAHVTEEEAASRLCELAAALQLTRIAARRVLLAWLDSDDSIEAKATASTRD